MTTTYLRPHSPAHESHSAVMSWYRCGKAYELERLSGMQALPAWWFIGGSCVHEVTEWFDRLLLAGIDVSLESLHEATIEKLNELAEQERITKGVPYDQWLAGGRWPKKSGYEWWVVNAPLMVERYAKWRLATMWEVADFAGVPGIECDLLVSLEFGQFRGAPDRVFRLPSGQLVVLDVKSGTAIPKEPLQLGTYANMIEQLGFERPAWGTYAMVKQEDPDKMLTPLVPLDKYTTSYLEGIYGPGDAGIRIGAFAPNVGDACRTCPVAKGCYAAGGEDSRLWDRLHPLYEGRN